MGDFKSNTCYAVVFTALVTVLIVSYNDVLKNTTIIVVGPPKNVQLSRQYYSLEDLSKIVQDQLTQLQNPKFNPRNCSVPTIHCGHLLWTRVSDSTTNRLSCLMVSYGYNMPLIHDELTTWPYSKHWNQIFYPLGSPCTPGLLTRYITYPFGPNVRNGSTQQYPFYLPTGIPVPKSIADRVELLLPEPYYWWLGQFMKYGLRLLPAEANLVKTAQSSLNFTHPIVGVHVRRSDKLSEQLNVFHKVEDYFDVANEYFYNLTLNNVTFDVKRVFVASDDPNVLVEASQKYPLPEWEVIGYFNNSKNLVAQYQRSEVLDQIVTDLFTLADCDFVVCTHSSNVCRAVLGLLSARCADGPQRVKSLDFNYSHDLIGNYAVPLEIVKV